MAEEQSSSGALAFSPITTMTSLSRLHMMNNDNGEGSGGERRAGGRASALCTQKTNNRNVAPTYRMRARARGNFHEVPRARGQSNILAYQGIACQPL